MALDTRFIGKKYGPFVYEAGLEKMREFSYAVGGVCQQWFTGQFISRDYESSVRLRNINHTQISARI